MKPGINRDWVVRMYTCWKWSTVQIGRKVGLTPGAVSSILYSRGVKTRTSKQGWHVRFPNGRNGKLAANWKGGRRIANQAGYICVYSPSHPYRTKEGYVMEHRLVMEKKLGRYLKPTEIVHHKDGDKSNNRISNLEYIQTKGEHVRRHFSAVKRVHELEEEVKRLKQRLGEA